MIFQGIFLHKFGSNTLTPYPIGIDISKSGDILIGDSHGNHFHVVVFNSKGIPQQDYKCLSQKVNLFYLTGLLEFIKF